MKKLRRRLLWATAVTAIILGVSLWQTLELYPSDRTAAVPFMFALYFSGTALMFELVGIIAVFGVPLPTADDIEAEIKRLQHQIRMEMLR